MQSHPGEIAAKAVPSLEVVRQEGEERALKTALSSAFDGDLGRDQYQGPKMKGTPIPCEREHRPVINASL
jgi:hypothetical protein